MRYDNLALLEKSFKGAASQEQGPLYFILTKSLFQSREATELLLSHLLPAGEKRELALTLFDGANLSEATVNEALDSYSFFSKSQVVVIQHFDKVRKGVQEQVELFISRPQPGISLVLCAESWSKATSFYKAIEKSGVVLELPELKPWEKEKQLVAWVNKQVAATRKLMSYQACQLFVKRAGDDQGVLAQELEKLLCYCIDKREITERDVEAICTTEHTETVWQLGEAIFRRDAAAALHIGKEFLLDGQPFLSLLRQIRSQFQISYQISLLLAQGKHDEDVMREYPYMKGQILKRNTQQAQHYGCAAFKEGVLAIDHAEIQAKNSSTDEMILLELLLFTLTEPRKT